MYCTNCGNKVHENAYVCVKCGVILDNNINSNDSCYTVQKRKDKGSGTGVTSIIFASFALLFCLNCFSVDISDVGMYTEIIDRIFYAIGFTLFPIIFSTVSFILALVNKKKTCNKVGLALSLLSFFLIITEFVVVTIY